MGRLQQVDGIEGKAAMPQHLFRGKTEADIETQYLAWHHDRAGLIRNVVRHDIEPLAMPVRNPGQYQKKEAPDAFSMLVDYEESR